MSDACVRRVPEINGAETDEEDGPADAGRGEEAVRSGRLAAGGGAAERAGLRGPRAAGQVCRQVPAARDDADDGGRAVAPAARAAAHRPAGDPRGWASR